MNQEATSAAPALSMRYFIDALARDVTHVDGDLKAVGHGHGVVGGRHHEAGHLRRKLPGAVFSQQLVEAFAGLLSGLPDMGARRIHGLDPPMAEHQVERLGEVDRNQAI